MKKLLLLSLIVVFAIATGFSQNILISFEDFEKAISNVKIHGFTIIPDEGDIDDDEEYDVEEYGDYAETEYSLSYMSNDGKVIIITMYMRTGEPVWTDKPYEFEDVQVEYTEFREMKLFNADLKFINAVLTISSTGNHNKKDLESFFKSSGLAKIKPAAANWPSEIPLEYRVKGRIIEITISETGTEFKSLISVTAQMDETLNKSYKSLLNTYGEGESFINLPNGIIFSPPFGDVVEDLYDKKNDGELLKFQYHIP
jgi:hypothetical protein